VPEIGKEGKRLRHTSRDMAMVAIGLSVVMLAIGVVSQDLPRADFPLVVCTAGPSIAIAASALLIKHRLTRRIVALIAMNGALVAGLATAAMMPR